MTSCPIGGFIIDKKHILLFARNVIFNDICFCFLLYMPNNFVISFLAIEFCFTVCPEFREIKLICLAFVPECRKQFLIERNTENLWTPATNIKYAVIQFLAAYFAC